MEDAPHRIRQYRWVVTASAPDEGFAIRQRLRDEWGGGMLSAMARAFDEAETGERVLHIPKIELNLRVASESEFVTLLPELIYRQLDEQLRGMLSSAGERRGELDDWQELTSAQDRFAMVVHYLRHGALPWAYTDIASADIIEQVRAICRQDIPRLAQLLRNEADRVVWLYRLLQLQHESELYDFAPLLHKAIQPSGRGDAERVLNAVMRSDRAAVSRHVRLRLMAVLLAGSLQSAAGGIDFISTAIIRQELSSEEATAFLAILSASPELMLETSGDEDAGTGSAARGDLDGVRGTDADESAGNDASASPRIPSDQSLEGTQLADGGEVATSDGKGIATGGEAAESKSRRQPGLRTDALLDELMTSHDERSTASDDGSGFAIRVWNAGLVLLHPFIPALFANRGLVESGSKELVNTSIARAAALLHFLATGGEEIYEYELGLCKVMLGLTPETPLYVSEGLLHKSDMDEADTLLRSAIGHWSLLKSTSVDGMRQSFLQRRGLLRNEDSGWRLRVEPESYDMLLKYLPWGLSIIKLPWMVRPMHIEWATP